jgi:hypothetical protein
MLRYILFAALAALPIRDDGRYANSPLKPWFDSLRSAKGYCCSDADGHPMTEGDWRLSDDGRHYRVSIEGRWWDVPDNAVILEPNLAGRPMVWYTPTRSDENNLYAIDIRCFMPGTLM